MEIISQVRPKRNSNLVLIGILLIFVLKLDCQAREVFKMKNPSANLVDLKLAITRAEHTQGLSNIKSGDFKNSMGMLFINSEMGPRKFWMPNTYFNLDIIFLDASLKITGIEKNVPAHPGMNEPPTIYKTATYDAQFVLETKAGANFGKKLKINDQLKFIGSTGLAELALKAH